MSQKSKCLFEFTLYNISKLHGDIYSPPFATSGDMYWQLVFNRFPYIQSAPDHPKYCSLGLRAIPNPEEEHESGVWTKRGTLSAVIFVKDPRTLKRIDYGEADLNGFTATRRGYGWKDFCNSTDLPSHGEVIFGVEFTSGEVSLQPHVSTLPSKAFPKDLSEAWLEKLNVPECADVQFNVNDHVIYADSAILSKRSEYFQKFFGGEWSENRQKSIRRYPTRSSREHNDKSLESKGNTATPMSDVVTANGKTSAYQFEIDIPDYHHLTFLEMLRFLYTDQITFLKRKDSHQTCMDLFDIADKYLIADLRQRAKVKILQEISPNSVTEILFNFSWKWPDLKEEVMKYAIEHWQQVIKTVTYKAFRNNPGIYPMSSEVLVELLERFTPSAEEERTPEDMI
ncbi:9919_t:CDS:2 [Paraglomus brasilianum]|uniref:9919_t:CDS:1 n=1 Tax=Paraglomus brasilianum TaxID=144538 RepID=A0A9N8VW86_9GLOM|nr:9919_t:CDS:2 [Paraglomus brasilianum]